MAIRILLIMALLSSWKISFSQVIEYVSFDNYTSVSDNDFVNNFSNGTGITMDPVNGITGGCLLTPATMGWGIDNAIYCSRYSADNGSSAVTRISFYYDTTLINAANFDRAVSIFLNPSSDPNHYVIASVMYDKKLQVISYSWVNNPVVLNLIHHHWYELMFTASFGPGFSVSVSASVNDLGTTGLFPPIPAGSASGNFADSVLAGDTSVVVSLTGTTNGGATRLDNFRFQGIKSPDSCATVSSASDNLNLQALNVFQSGSKLIIYNASEISDCDIYSITGQHILKQKITQDKCEITLPDLTQGIYIIRLKNLNSATNFKLFINH